VPLREGQVEKVTPVRPGASVLRTIQDRLVQKQFLDKLGLPQTPWAVADAAGLAKVGLPAIVKVRRAGYDGKGQVRVDPDTDADAALARLKGEPAVVEALVPFVREVSVILARGIGGTPSVFVQGIPVPARPDLIVAAVERVMG